MKFRLGLLIGSLAFGFLGAVGPASASASVAGASAAADPYPRTVKTVCDARALKNPYRAGKKERFRMTIIENSTDLPRVRLTYVKQIKMANGKYRTVKKYRPKRYYHGRPVNLPFTTTRVGKFRIIIRTNFGPKSQFRNCRDSFVYRTAGARSPQPADTGNNNGNNGNGELPNTGARNKQN